MSMKLTDYLGDKPFWKVTVRLAVPVALQNVLTSSFQLVDTLMVSRLGDVTLSAVGMAAQWGWMAGLLSFGLCSGMSVFISQYWGIQNLKGIRRVMGLGLLTALLISAVLTAIYLMGPAMSMYFRPLEGMEKVVNCDPGLRMKLPFAVLTAAIVLCGLFSDPIITLLAKLSAGVM